MKTPTINPLRVPCPTCGADTGHRCPPSGWNGPGREAHTARFAAATARFGDNGDCLIGSTGWCTTHRTHCGGTP